MGGGVGLGVGVGNQLRNNHTHSDTCFVEIHRAYSLARSPQIFHSMSEPCEVEERWDPMTRRNLETIREVDVETVQVIRFDAFVEMFTLFMEAHLKLIDLGRHEALRKSSESAPFRGVGLSALESHVEIFNYESGRLVNALNRFF